ncbi:MAG: GDP-mannose 4,6-dehydratase [Candidatus Pacebacteria bacterium]|nr:GDP-mannose 4,6-dehydratase [Candidatus Paceibacterota bacterium]MCF7856945.1 GDP-mannose 4,6-dehydratase [Candidatus Paceibacterota bacterium]
MKKALITGITGQDGSYLAEFLLQKGYEVHGLMRRSSTEPLIRIQDIVFDGKVTLHMGDLRDPACIQRVIELVSPDEIYNFAAQSDVGISFKCPEEAYSINFEGVRDLVEAAWKHNKDVRFYQASTSEMFGSTNPPQNEKAPFQPVSPYAEAKLKAHQDVVLEYRKKYGMHISSGILFNHESPRRGKHFVTRKITHSLAKVKLGLQTHVTLGNLEAKRDWGYAGDYVEAMWLMLQAETADDYVIATGESRSVRDFVEAAADSLGMKITWEGEGVDEVGKDEHGDVVVKISKNFYRPAEVDYLLGDATKAKEKLGWTPKTTFQELVHMMVASDLKDAKYEQMKKSIE